VIYRLIALLEAAAMALSLIGSCNAQDQLDLSILLDQPAAVASAGDTLDLSLLGIGDAAAQEPVECLDLSVLGIEVEAVSLRTEALDLSVLGVDDLAPIIKPDSQRMCQPKASNSAEIPLQRTAPGQSQMMQGASYPTHSQRWNVAGNWSPSREQLVAHLMGGQHSGKFSQSYLNGLSVAELKSLHDDDHEGRVQGSYVQQVATKPIAPAVTPATTTVRYASPCPGGKCPTYSYGYATTKAPRKGIFALFSRK
jgi:hypothetical protein